jgi:MFS family permease
VPFTWRAGRGFTPAQIGIFLAGQRAARAVAAPVSGWLSDGFGTRLLTWLGTVLTAAGDASASGILACVGFVLGGFLEPRIQGTIK